MRPAQHGDLAQLAVAAGRLDELRVSADEPGAVPRKDAHCPNLVRRPGVRSLEQSLAAATDGDEPDLVPVESGEVPAGGEATVEGGVADGRAVAPEEVEDRLGVRFASEAGVGGQDQAAVRIWGEGRRQPSRERWRVPGPGCWSVRSSPQ